MQLRTTSHAERSVDSMDMGDTRDDPIPLPAAAGDDARNSTASVGRASRAWSTGESVEIGDAHELATIRVRTMYGCAITTVLRC